MKSSRRELRVLLLHGFGLGHKAVEATNNICCTIGPSVMSLRTAQHWFDRFRNNNYELEDQHRSGRPLEIDLDLLKQLIEQDPRLTTRCLAEQLECSYTTVQKHLGDLGKTWKYGVWIPHELSPYQLQSRADVCVNHTRRRQWLGSGETGVPTPKMDLHPQKVMLSVWWGIKGIIHWEFLPPGCTITAATYCQQLDRVAQQLQRKQNRIHFLHDNARPHVAKLTRENYYSLAG